MNQLKKNYLYNVTYQILALLVPLITIPYVSRVLGAEGVGTYSYTYSIAYYFVLFTQLGIENHGNRTIAKTRDNKDKMSKEFLSIISIQIFLSVIMSIVYLFFCLFITNNDKTISLLQTIYIISAGINISWFFFGLEKFKITVIRNAVIKFFSLIMILLFVKNRTDVWIYTLILALSSLISQIYLIPYLRKEISFQKISFEDIKKQIKPILILFIPILSISLYKIMDKIMLGIITTVSDVGYYEQAEKIINVPITIIAALGTVMLPQASNLVASNQLNKVKEYMYKSFEFIMFLALPMVFGLIAISDEFVPLFMGEAFTQSANIIKYLSFTILVISFANVIRKQFLIPMEYDKIFVISVSLGALINLILNLILIPFFKSNGAAIATIAAEFTVMIIQVIAVRKEINFKRVLTSIKHFALYTLLMFLIVSLIDLLHINNLLNVILKTFIGGSIYLIFNWKYIFKILHINLKRGVKNA